MRAHLVTIHLEMVLGTSHPFILVEVRHFEFWGDNNIWYQAKICHVHEWIVTKAFNSPQSLLEEIEFPSFFGRRGWSFCGQDYWLCYEVGMGQSVGCRPLNGDRGIEINIPLGMLLMIFMRLVGLLRRLPFKDGRRDMTRIILHDWRRVIRRQSIRVSRSVVSQMGVAVVPQCVPSSSYRIWGRIVRGG